MADESLEAGLLDPESPAVMDATDISGEIDIPVSEFIRARQHQASSSPAPAPRSS